MTANMGLRFVVAVLSLASVSCGGPTTPSGPGLVVRVIDENTGLPITDPLFGIVVHLSGPSMYTQPATNGAATFSGVVAGTYRVTTEFDFLYRQLDIISLTVDRSQTFTLSMIPVDDLVATEVFVDGQGSIPKGGTISIPAGGVTLTLRGRYQLIRYSNPIRLFFLSDFHVLSSDVSGPLSGYGQRSLSQTEWEASWTRWLPCYFSDATRPARACATASDVLHLALEDAGARAGAGLGIMDRLQPWPVKFRLESGCCDF